MNKIGHYSVDQYIDALTEFHGNFAPGLFLGGFMVAAGIEKMAQYEFFDAICESPACLPDAVQMLTPCTIGNGWLRIINTGRYAVTLYDKKSGNGVRIGLDATKIDRFPEIKNWFMRLTSKHDQDRDTLIREIRTAGSDIFTIKNVTVSPELRGKHDKGRIVLCESCGEAYPDNGGPRCPVCQGTIKNPYI